MTCYLTCQPACSANFLLRCPTADPGARGQARAGSSLVSGVLYSGRAKDAAPAGRPTQLGTLAKS